MNPKSQANFLHHLIPSSAVGSMCSPTLLMRTPRQKAVPGHASDKPKVNPGRSFLILGAS